MSKYNNIITEVDGHRFDSRKEADFYVCLKNDKTVKSIELQPSFLLQEKFTHPITKKKYRAIIYRADFLVEYVTGVKEIIDIKGMKTEAFKLKEKLFLYRYPDLTLTII